MIRRVVIIGLTAILLVGGIFLGAETVQGLIQEVPTVALAEIRTQLGPDGPMVLLDVRNPDEIAAAPLSFPGLGIPLTELKTRTDELAPYHTTTIVVCSGGARARQAVRWLHQAGYQVVWLNTGLEGLQG